MPLTSIVTIVLRIYCINWLVVNGYVILQTGREIARAGFASTDYLDLVIPAAAIVPAFLIFIWSQPIARLVTPKPDAQVHVGGLTRSDLYSFAFVFLGLYFVLSSLADALNWLHHFLLVIRETESGSPKRTEAFYGLTLPMVTLMGGGASLIFATRLAAALGRLHSKQGGAV